jgi:hypothetical protein
MFFSTFNSPAPVLSRRYLKIVANQDLGAGKTGAKSTTRNGSKPARLHQGAAKSSARRFFALPFALRSPPSKKCQGFYKK